MFKTQLRLAEASYKTFSLIDPLVYEGKYDTFVIPAGYETDFASVPASATWLIPTYGLYTKAAVVHDYLCDELKRYHYHPESLRLGTEDMECSTHLPPASSVDTDGIFRRIMRELGVPFVRRWLMWTGVRWGAIASPYRRKGSLKTLPLVLLVSILALPFILVPTIFVMLGQLVDKIAESL